MFLTQSHKFLEISKVSLRLQRYSCSIMSTFLQCDAPVRGDKSQLQFLWGVGVGFFAPLQEQFAENANKRYHVCKVIVVLHIYHKSFGIR